MVTLAAIDGITRLSVLPAHSLVLSLEPPQYATRLAADLERCGARDEERNSDRQREQRQDYGRDKDLSRPPLWLVARPRQVNEGDEEDCDHQGKKAQLVLPPADMPAGPDASPPGHGHWRDEGESDNPEQAFHGGDRGRQTSGWRRSVIPEPTSSLEGEGVKGAQAAHSCAVQVFPAHPFFFRRGCLLTRAGIVSAFDFADSATAVGFLAQT